MDLKISDYIDGKYSAKFVVHAPELFSKSRLMDLASEDDEYRNFSIKETQRVINITRELKKFFPSTNRPLIVANIGGFSMDSPIHDSKKQSLYKLFGDSLKNWIWMVLNLSHRQWLHFLGTLVGKDIKIFCKN